MSNGSFLTSQLPVTTNAVGSDRLLILWNAIANVSVGSGSPQTMMIGINDLVNNALSTVEADLMTAGTLTFGNSTVNSVINSTSVTVSNSSATIFTINSTGVVVGNGAGLTSIPAAGSNTYLLFNKSGYIAGAANLTWDGATTLSFGNSLVNTTVNSVSFTNGNTFINATTLSVGNGGTVLVGNATYNTVISPQSITISNNGVTVYQMTGAGAATLATSIGVSTINATTVGTLLTNNSLTIGNSSVNTFLDDQSALITGNSTVNTTVNSTIITLGVVGAGGNAGISISNNSITIGNSTVNTSANSTHFFSGNSTVFGYTNSTAEAFANSTGNCVTTPLSIYFQTNSSANSIHSNASLTFNSNSTVNGVVTATSLVFQGGTVNAQLNSTSFSLATINATTSGFLVNTTTFMIGNSTVNTTANSTHFFSGNSTVFGWTNSTAEAFANSTGNSISTPLSIMFQTNSSSNSTLSNASLTFNTNSSLSSSVNTTTFAFNTTGAAVIRPSVSVLLANNTLANVATVQNLFSSGQNTCTLAATTTYLMDGHYMLQYTAAVVAVAHTISTAFGNSVAIGSIQYTAWAAVGNNNTMAAGANVQTTQAFTNAATVITPSVTNNNETLSVRIKGLITTVGAVGITPQLSYSVAPNNTPKVLTGSYMIFTPVSNSTTGAAFGTWA